MRRKIMTCAFGIATMVNAMCAEPSIHVPPSQFHTPHVPPFNRNLDLAPVASVGGPCEEYRDAHEVDVRNGGPISPIGGVSFPKCR